MMSGLKIDYSYVDELDYKRMAILYPREASFIESVRKARAHALAEGIKANSIVINENMVEVPDAWINMLHGARHLPRMICGLNVYLTKDELPENYSFAVCEGPGDRLSKFESIGMEPDELRKAAELYRKVKEVMG